MLERYLNPILEILAVLTGFIHLYVGYQGAYETLILAGLGFLVGTVLFVLLENYRDYIIALSIPYTGVQFYFAYQTYGLNVTTTLAVDKLVQLFLIMLGIYYLYESRDDNFLNRL